MLEKKKFSFVKPDLDTPFHIDFEWWMKNDSNWRVFLHSCLCSEHQVQYIDNGQDSWLDWVDPHTGAVKQIDGLQSILINHCAKQPTFITQNTTVVDAVFRILLAGGNSPMSVNEMASAINKPASMILRTLSGGTVYRGLRPFSK